jgi:phage terminase large subunit-like protein
MPSYKFRTERYLEYRQRGRTDLLWFCRRVLKYSDVCAEVHGPIIEKLQKFKGGKDKHEIINDKLFLQGYTPACDLWDLEGPRKRLFLDPRGFLKTTVISIGHALQWILNYPDIRILVSMATGDQVDKVMTEIRGHFQFNEIFRFLFPEFCPPPKKAADFGNQQQFTVPARKKKWLKEPTVSTCTVGKVIAGGHYEVIKNSDLVDKENIRTPGQIQGVKDHFYYLNPLLERNEKPPHHGWTDVEGTLYDFSDLYSSILEQEERLKDEGSHESYQISVRAAQTNGVPLWPSRFPMAELERIRREMGEELFSSQYLQNPLPKESALATADIIQWVPRPVVRALLPQLRLHATMDLHGMEDKDDNDYTALTVCGFDRDGRPYIVDIWHGRPDPFEAIEWIFESYAKYPGIIDYKLEKDAHARVLLPFMQRECAKRQKYPLVVPIRRDPHMAKQHRIRGLQPWFKTRTIRFVDDLSCKLDLLNEITRFPKFSHDDLLDTLADQLQNRDGGVTYDVLPGPPRFEIPSRYAPWQLDKFLGFEAGTGRQQWVYGGTEGAVPENENYHKGTGL